ncbi:hypothetical protein BJ165DRAFT_333745 [Panaeolus papilionaceus]|nr:hypothetical protein BJ165DRAFT_333745 [Panaeolus papilionaceus]
MPAHNDVCIKNLSSPAFFKYTPGNTPNRAGVRLQSACLSSFTGKERGRVLGCCVHFDGTRLITSFHHILHLPTSTGYQAPVPIPPHHLLLFPVSHHPFLLTLRQTDETS